MAAEAIDDPTGIQHRLRGADGRVSATITQLGASLRALQVDGVDLVPAYPAGTPTPSASGIVLVPWPNRIRDGKWTQRGETRQLAISEPKFGNASHGLLRFAPYSPFDSADDALTLGAEVFPQTGYPFHLRTTVTYALTDDGIRVTHVVTNVGADEAPLARGFHPFFCVDGVAEEDLVIRSSGAMRLVLDERMLPTATEPVDAATDLREGRRLGDVDLDTTYSELDRDDDGIARTTLTAPDGRVVTVWQGPGLDHVQVFTTDRYPGRPLAVAIEPMSAPPDALNSGDGLVWLAPGETSTVNWGVAFTAS